MPTVYSNYRHPKLNKWIAIIGGICGIAALAFLCLSFLVWKADYSLFLCPALLVLSALTWSRYRPINLTVDESKDSVSLSTKEKRALSISKLASVTYKEDRRGKFSSLLIHEAGPRFMEFHTTVSNADLIAAQLRKANPEVEVKHGRSA